jgi:hypothetical protein
MKNTLLVVLVCCLIAIIEVHVYYTYLLSQEVKLLQNRISATSEEFDEHMEDIYLLMKMDSSRLYTIMDTEVRILHYTKPHKHATFGCPECAEQKKRVSLDEPISGIHRHK